MKKAPVSCCVEAKKATWMTFMAILFTPRLAFYLGFFVCLRIYNLKAIKIHTYGLDKAIDN